MTWRMENFVCTYCQNPILTCRIVCAECKDLELCLQVSHVTQYFLVKVNCRFVFEELILVFIDSMSACHRVSVLRMWNRNRVAQEGPWLQSGGKFHQRADLGSRHRPAAAACLHQWTVCVLCCCQYAGSCARCWPPLGCSNRYLPMHVNACWHEHSANNENAGQMLRGVSLSRCGKWILLNIQANSEWNTVFSDRLCKLVQWDTPGRD